ncbi:hypothetical protein PG987_013789 [Apiospora arundinis]
MKLSQLLPVYGLCSFALAADKATDDKSCPLIPTYKCGDVDIFKGQLSESGNPEDGLLDLSSLEDALPKRAPRMGPRHNIGLLQRDDEDEDDDEDFNSDTQGLFGRATPAGNPPTGQPAANPAAGQPAATKPKKVKSDEASKKDHYNFCKMGYNNQAQKTLIEKTTKFGNNFMDYKTPSYEEEPLVELYVKDWTDCGDFELKENKRTAGMKKTAVANDKHRLDSEHVLERHMLQKFFGAKAEGKWPEWIPKTKTATAQYKGDYEPKKPFDDDGGKWEDFCQMLNHYWAADRKDPTSKAEAFVDVSGKKEYAWDVAASGWPNKEQGQMFQPGKRLRDLDRLTSLEKKLASGKIKSKEIITLAEERAGYVATMRAVILVNAYMKRDDVKKTYKKQVERVVKTLKKAEDAVEANWKKTTDPKGAYKPQKLDEAFQTWIKADTTESIKKLKDFLTDAKTWMDEQVKDMKAVEAAHAKDSKKPDLSAGDKTLKTNMEKTLTEINKLQANNGLYKVPSFTDRSLIGHHTPISSYEPINMKKLSPEILLLIIESLGDYEEIAPYATISRQWQNIIESRTMCRIKFDSADDLSFFRSVFSHPQAKYRRRSGLRLLEVNISRPNFGFSDRKTGPKQQTYQVDATALLQELSSWKHDPVNAYSFDVRLECWENYYREVPSLSGSPSASAMASAGLAPFVPNLLVQIRPGLVGHALATAERFSALQALSIFYDDRQDRWHRRRRQDRHLSIIFEREDPKNQNFIDQNLEDDDGVDPLCDALRRFGQVEAPLRRLTLYNIMLSEDLFCNRRLPQGADADTATWPLLEELDIHVYTVAPSGEYYFTGDDNSEEDSDDDDDDGDEDDEEDEEDEEDSDEYDVSDTHSNSPVREFDGECDSSDEQSAERLRRPDAAKRDKPVHIWRDRPDPATFNPLALEFAAAVARRSMPQLQSAKLTMTYGGFALHEVTLWCKEAGVADGWWSDWAGKRRSDMPIVRLWKYMRENRLGPWKPSKEIVDEWRKWLGEDGLIFELVDPKDTELAGVGVSGSTTQLARNVEYARHDGWWKGGEGDGSVLDMAAGVYVLD